ncbi:hypothetical protein DFQ28_001395 [Apophysomyces sp. BC1034]|nr:hypothetical protein DFQ30_001769 [Apophysomyces sp. BC1015]KAG0174030.1 hypothetical protein DFQ29_007645 [Apophysomyces sp. BC1021]KAG0190879.1 hypothetical protein DFQ28_001395 [Apophysomyces sp. BC1034]
MIKNLGKLKQWTGERLGSAKATLQTEDFQRLEVETEQRRAGFEKVYEASQLQYGYLSKKKPSPDDPKTKVYPMEIFATSWTNHGDAFPGDSALGVALINYGEAESRISGLQEDFASNMKENYMVTLDRGLQEYKEYLNLRKKLESRRLDYDAKLSRLQKSKKEKPELEQEMYAAKMKYEETEYDLIQKMVSLQEYEDEHFDALHELLEAQHAYYSKSADILNNLRSTWGQGNLSGPVARNAMRSALARSPSMSPGTTPRSNQNGSGDDYFMHHPEPSGLVPRSPGNTFAQRRPSNRQQSGDSLNTGMAPRRVPSHTSLRSNGGDDVSSSPGRLAPPAIPRRQSQNSIQTKKRRKAVYDFDGDSVDELCFRAGDVITVVEEVDEGWWLGEVENNGPKRRGIFPVNYTEELVSPPPMPARPAAAAATPTMVFDNPNELVEEPAEHSADESPFIDNRAPPAPTTSFSYIRPNQPTRTLSNNSFSTASSTPSPPLSRSSTTVPLSTKPVGAARTPPPPPPAARTPLNRTYTAPSTASRPPLQQARANTNDHPQEPSCSLCGCEDFSANLFKKGHCNNCFHKH